MCKNRTHTHPFVGTLVSDVSNVSDVSGGTLVTVVPIRASELSRRGLVGTPIVEKVLCLKRNLRKGKVRAYLTKRFTPYELRPLLSGQVAIGNTACLIFPRCKRNVPERNDA